MIPRRISGQPISAGPSRHDPEVAGERELAAPAERVPCDLGDDGLRQPLHAQERALREVDAARRLLGREVRVGKRLELRAGHEDRLVRAREHHRPDAVVALSSRSSRSGEVGVEVRVERVRGRLVEHAAGPPAPWRSTAKKRGWGRTEFKRSFGSVSRVCHMSAPSDSTSSAVSVLDGALALPASIVRGRAVAGGDEDAVTLAAEAALPCSPRADEPPGS